MNDNKVYEKETIIEKYVPIEIVKVEKEIVEKEVIKHVPSGLFMTEEKKL